MPSHGRATVRSVVGKTTLGISPSLMKTVSCSDDVTNPFLSHDFGNASVIPLKVEQLSQLFPATVRNPLFSGRSAQSERILARRLPVISLPWNRQFRCRLKRQNLTLSAASLRGSTRSPPFVQNNCQALASSFCSSSGSLARASKS